MINAAHQRSLAYACRAVIASALMLIGLAACRSTTQQAEPDESIDRDSSTVTSSTGNDTVQTTAEGAVETTAEAAEETAESSAPEDTADGATDDVTIDPIQWVGCGGSFQCATAAVPLDYEDVSGETIEIALIRVAATGEVEGSIFINLGGPGGSTISAMRNGFRLDDDTMATHHLVGFDPRGIGLSSPLNCQIDLTSSPRADLSPDTDEERAELDAEAQTLAQRCGELDGDILPHLGTSAVVSDLEVLRRAVGDDQLRYLGLSYGTVIGLRYAERHPDLVGRMVLDGVVDPSFSLTDLLTQQALEFERAFETMDAACGLTITCPDGGVRASFDRVGTTLEANGASDGVGITELEVATLVAMYSERLWPRLGSALIAAEAGDYSEVERLHDLYTSGTSFAAYAAVSCIDSSSPSGSGQWDAFAAELAGSAPRFGAALANELRACAFWPTGPTSTPQPVTAKTDSPVLILSTTGDAPTPLTNAITVSQTLDSAGLVIADDEGHTAYGTNFCVDRIVAAYFATGAVQEEPHRC